MIKAREKVSCVNKSKNGMLIIFNLHASILQRTLTHSGVEIEVSLEAVEPV